jgi:hypothetical protein
LHKKFRKKDHYDVIGLSASRHGAFTLLTQVFTDVFANTGTYRVKQYMLGQME